MLCLFAYVDSGAKSASDGKFGFGTFQPGYPSGYGKIQVDLFAIWNRELTDADITALYNAQL